VENVEIRISAILKHYESVDP